ncbi:hypothetical protein X801_02932, partial [Opisthorchis viverrini]
MPFLPSDCTIIVVLLDMDLLRFYPSLVKNGGIGLNRIVVAGQHMRLYTQLTGPTTKPVGDSVPTLQVISAIQYETQQEN